MGDNSGRIDFESEDRRALFYSHINPIWELEKKLDEMKAQKTKLKRQAKAEGFEAFEIDFALRCRKAEKPETIDNQIQRLVAVARYMAQPIGFQFDMMAGDDRPSEDRAFDEGMAAGLRGDTLVNPHDPSVPQHTKFNDGWRLGQKQLGEAFSKRKADEKQRLAEEKAAGKAGAAEPKRGRGRPKGVKNRKTGAYTERLREQNDAIAQHLNDGTFGEEEQEPAAA